MINLVQYFFWSYFFPTSLQITIIIPVSYTHLTLPTTPYV